MTTATQTGLALIGRVAAAVIAATAIGGAHAAPASPVPNRSAFEFNMHKQLEGTVMGYSFVLMKDGVILAEGAGGKARNAADGFKPMTTSTPQNVGSLFKFISGVTLLSLLDRRGISAGPSNLSAALNFPYYLLLPRFWTAEIKVPEIKSVTIRQVLQHKSGLRGTKLISSFRGEFDPALIGVRDYENINFSIVGYMLASQYKPDLLTQMDSWDKSAPFEERYAVSKNVLGISMDKYVRQLMTTQVPGKPIASCDAANEFKATGAYAYKSKSDTGKGIITSRVELGMGCTGAGGYAISARHLAAFASAALHTNNILSANAHRVMRREGMDPDDRLIWSSASKSDWAKDNYAESYIYGSGGRQGYGDGQVAGGSLLRLPGGYILVTLANSPEWSSDDLANFGMKAFVASVQ